LRITYPDLVGCTVVLFLSRLDCKKGLDLLLPAFARVRANHPDAFLLMAGDGDAPFVANLKRQALRLGLDAGIRWTGFLHGEEKRSALADADIFVLPSYSENFGVAVLEALAAALPVIVSDQVGIHREVARAQAGLVIECSVEQLESALVKAITDKQFRAEMSANAVELSRQFVPEIVTQQLIETYARICSKRVRPIAA
jgi:glycosyltransferase involved in cell wall biosynthesis